MIQSVDAMRQQALWSLLSHPGPPHEASTWKTGRGNVRGGVFREGTFPTPAEPGDVGLGGTAAAAPPPFRPSEPALCGSCPLVTPY